MENQEYGGDDALEAPPPPAKRSAAVVVDERNIDEDDDAIDLLMPRTRVDTPRKGGTWRCEATTSCVGGAQRGRRRQQ
jgi:hypothetical protein